jgi:hypothetical protein
MTISIEKIAFLVVAVCSASFAGHVLAYDGHRETVQSLAGQTEPAGVGAKADVTKEMAQVRSPTSRDNRSADDEHR